MVDVFSKEWFQKYQASLLWVCNTRWGRDILHINGKRSSVGNNKIVRIDPNAIFWVEDEKLKVEFRTHNKFSKRLFHSFKDVWSAMHWFDMKIANPYVPAFNLGFDTFFPDAGSPGTTTIDGYIHRYVTSETFSTIRAGAGTYTSAGNTQLEFVRIISSSTSNQYQLMRRFHLGFNTSSLDDGASIDTATLSIWGIAKNAGLGVPEMGIVSSSPASNTVLANSDYGNFGTTDYATRYTYGGWSNTAYNTTTFNAAGKSAISLNGVTNLGCRFGWDIDNIAPTWKSVKESYLSGETADSTGTTKDPKLVVEVIVVSGSLHRLLLGVG